MKGRAGTLVRVAVVVAAVCALAAAWALTPLRTLATPDELQKLIAPVTSSPLLPLYTLAAFVVAGALFLSVWLVIFQTSLLFSPLVAFPLALGGAALSAVVFYGVGRAVGEDVVVKHVPERVQRAVRGAGLEAIIAVRLLPVLPFTFVNVCCGAFGVRFSTFVAGTVVGMAPGVLGMTLLGERLLAVIRQPTPLSVGALLLTAAALIGGATWFRRRAGQKQSMLEAQKTTPTTMELQ